MISPLLFTKQAHSLDYQEILTLSKSWLVRVYIWLGGKVARFFPRSQVKQRGGKYQSLHTRQYGWELKIPTLPFGCLEFKSRPYHWLDLFVNNPKLTCSALLINSQLVCLLSLLLNYFGIQLMASLTLSDTYWTSCHCFLVKWFLIWMWGCRCISIVLEISAPFARHVHDFKLQTCVMPA